MNLWMVVLAAAVAVVAFFVWANRQTAKAHARFTLRDLEIALVEVLDPHARTHDTWDRFLAWPINNPYLESVRQACQRIFQECPGGHGKGHQRRGRETSGCFTCGTANSHACEQRRRRCSVGHAMKSIIVVDSAAPDGSSVRTKKRRSPGRFCRLAANCQPTKSWLRGRATAGTCSCGAWRREPTSGKMTVHTGDPLQVRGAYPETMVTVRPGASGFGL